LPWVSRVHHADVQFLSFACQHTYKRFHTRNKIFHTKLIPGQCKLSQARSRHHSTPTCEERVPLNLLCNHYLITTEHDSILYAQPTTRFEYMRYAVCARIELKPGTEMGINGNMTMPAIKRSTLPALADPSALLGDILN